MLGILQKNFKYYLIIFFICIIICGTLFGNKMFASHDLKFHTARIMNIVYAILDGQTIPTIAPDYCNGFGYSWTLFYGGLFPYLVLLVSLIVENIYVSIKIVLFFIILFSAITMYNLINDISKSKKLALLIAIFYILAPYKLIDVYLRLAVGELLAFVFIPMVFHGLYNIIKDNGNKHYLLVIGVVGTVYAHNISLIMVLIFALYFL